MPAPNDRNELHNRHVYTYWRWHGWIAEQQNRHWGAFFFRDFARQEMEGTGPIDKKRFK